MSQQDFSSITHPSTWEAGSTVLTIGKHRGSTFAQVALHDPGYCSWVMQLTAPHGQLKCFVDFLRGQGGNLAPEAASNQRTRLTTSPSAQAYETQMTSPALQPHWIRAIARPLGASCMPEGAMHEQQGLDQSSGIDAWSCSEMQSRTEMLDPCKRTKRIVKFNIEQPSCVDWRCSAWQMMDAWKTLSERQDEVPCVASQDENKSGAQRLAALLYRDKTKDALPTDSSPASFAEDVSNVASVCDAATSGTQKPNAFAQEQTLTSAHGDRHEKNLLCPAAWEHTTLTKRFGAEAANFHEGVITLASTDVDLDVEIAKHSCIEQAKLTCPSAGIPKATSRTTSPGAIRKRSSGSQSVSSNTDRGKLPLPNASSLCTSAQGERKRKFLGQRLGALRV